MDIVENDYDLLPSDLIDYYCDILSPEKYIKMAGNASEMDDPNILHVEEGWC